MKLRCLSIVICGLACLAPTAAAQPKFETVLGGLNNPCGIAIQPDTGVVYFSESGAGRVAKIVEGKVVHVITNFPADHFGDEPRYTIGPLGLCFLGKESLVVGGGGLPDGDDRLRVYDLTTNGDTPLLAEQVVAGFSLPAGSELPGEGDFFGVTAGQGAIFVTCHGDDEMGWIARAVLGEDERIESFERYIATKPAVGIDAPAAITFDPAERVLVVGQMGEVDRPGDSLLTFYHPLDKKLLVHHATGLNDIVALAYSPHTGQLYAADFSWASPDDGGLFQLIATAENGTVGMRAQKILSIARPTALAFAPTGELYIAAFGDGKNTGSVLRVPAGL